MNIPVTYLPSGGYGYDFPSINVSPMTFQEITKYLENVPKDDPLGKYLFDIETLVDSDPTIKNCYIMDIDFLIFYKKLVTVSTDLTFKVSTVCPDCGGKISKTINFETDIQFEQADSKLMEGAKIELGGNLYDTIVPRYTEFMQVFKKFLVYRKITDLNLIKVISLIKDFDTKGNQIEKDILNATHEDITLILMLQEVYFNHLKPLEVFCPTCCAGKAPEERRSIAMSVDSLIADFFREICINCPVNGTKILFK